MDHAHVICKGVFKEQTYSTRHFGPNVLLPGENGSSLRVSQSWMGGMKCLENKKSLGSRSIFGLSNLFYIFIYFDN